MLFLFIAAVTLISLYEGLPLFNKKLWRELGVMTLIISTAIFLGLADIVGITPPLQLLQQTLGSVGKLIFK